MATRRRASRASAGGDGGKVSKASSRGHSPSPSPSSQTLSPARSSSTLAKGRKDWEQKNWAKFATRVTVGVLMIALFLGILFAGHLYVCVLIAVLQTLIFRELLSVRYQAAMERQIPRFRSVQWAWYILAAFYVFGDDLLHFSQTRSIFPIVRAYQRYHSWMSFTLYSLVFVITVLSFKKGQLAWTILTIIMIVFQCKSIYGNIFNGLFWFFVPVSLVVCNDCFAYFCGFALGRKIIHRPFLTISPNKTWEGFIGAFFFTMVFAWIVSYACAQYEYFICPLQDFSARELHCDRAPVFQRQSFELPPTMQSLVQMETIGYLPVQLHALVFAVFVSFVAPFGGFFASAIKRAYKIKDFDSVIPGHGGITDRMDCQFITGCFVYVHYITFIREKMYGPSTILDLIVQLPYEDQLEILKSLKEIVLHNTTGAANALNNTS